MYRPPNWMSIIYHNVSTEIYDKREVKLGRMFFDRGGEAMLTALRKTGKRLSNTDLDVYGRLLNAPEHYPKGGEDEYKGTLVFIPDEE